ncbi:transcriptional regulator [Actinoplanes philippinensis]|uniref:Helix-turn-helix domain-containing protein n=1 Tax=Actinoplanes philippinensis TaxID=35752 RepID=A0A1I2K5M2_9ACTN|nr:helix-turn-helix transcriptional regulator [Actinoplanes philippinensis]GIE81455.1 transcriptional regulator [Actinoplanes philippinensis]SFF61648.1 Helix-turn-helix domain-containing protein [Actinoplanes philippinensis]
MSDIEGPTLRRRRLGAELKRCREAAGLTQQDVSRHFEWHSAKVTRIETARVAVTPRDVRDLLTLYNVRDQTMREALVELARQSRERTWWTDYRDIMRPGNFVGLEAAASAMRTWEPVLIPGLLQTPDYMRSLMRSGRPTDPEEHIDRRIALRQTRQGRLTSDRPLELSAFMDEGALHRVIGDREVMTEQLRHLIEIAKLPNVFLQILPFSAGAHPFLSGPAALLEFRETTHLDVVYMEGLAGDLYEEQPDMVDWYRQEFERLSDMALDHRTTIKMIEGLLVA